MGCGQSSKASQPAEQQHQPAIGSTPGGSSSSSTPAAVAAGGRLVVNSTATLVAAQAAGLALEGAKSAVPFAGALINGIERVHTVFKAHEDVQREIQHLAFRLEFIMATGDYNSLSDHERTMLDKVLEEVEDAVGRGYSRSLEKIFKPEDVRDDLVRAGRFLTDGLIHIGLYRSRTEELKRYEAQLPRSHFELSRDKVVVDEYLTESRCKVYLGTLTLENGQIARVAIKLCRPKGASTVEQLREELLKGECKLQYAASHRSILRLLGLVMHHPHPQCQGCVLLVTPYLELGSLEDVMGSDDASAATNVPRSKAFPDAQTLLTQPPECRTAIVQLLMDVSAGLRHIHGVVPAIVHLDVKPANVLLDYTEAAKGSRQVSVQPKLADFDLSRELAAERKTTTTAVALGTVGYMSPEATNPKLGKKGPWSDVFAFAMLTHFCITRRHPFAGMGDGEILLAMAKKKRPQLRASGSTCPAWSEALCSMAESAWVQEPRKRPTAEALWVFLWNQLEASRSGLEPGITPTFAASTAPASLMPSSAAGSSSSSIVVASSTGSASSSPSSPVSTPQQPPASATGSAAPSSVAAPQQAPPIATGIVSTPSAPQQPPVSATGSASSAAAAPQLAKGSSTGSTAEAATPSALLAAGGRFSLLLLQKRKELISFGENDDGRRDLPQELQTAGWTWGASRQRLRPSVEVLQVAAGGGHTLYLVQEEEEGEGRTAVHAAGHNLSKQCEVPQALGRGPKVKAVAAGNMHSLALTVAGKVLGWGSNFRGKTDVQAFEKVQLIAAGYYFSAVVTEDCKLHVVGDCDNLELKRGVQLAGTPIAMAAGDVHIVVLSSEGKAQAFMTSTEYGNHGQEIVPSSSIGERRIEAIACGDLHTVYLLEGGAVVAAGDNRHQQCDCRLQSSATAVAAGAFHTLVRLKDGTLQTFGQNDAGQCAVPDF